MHKNYRIIKKKEIAPLGATFFELQHHKTGARIMHIARDDKENVFSLSFQTIPHSSDGAPHILEHTVLCGSRKYPVKDAFFSMTRRSLSTFMNAFTGPDFTCYPAASCTPKDFYNLLDVYLDSVFHPLLKDVSFWQEGHRFAFDDACKLTYKGVVYNEMKGAFSSPETRLWNAVTRYLMPDLCYTHVSGGDPVHIPELTHEGLKEFHETYYAPGRCLFYSYGDLDLEKHLSFLDEKVLKHAEKCSPLPQLPLQKRFDKPLFHTEFYPSSSDEAQPLMSIAWLTTLARDSKEATALSLIDSIIMDTDASPLKRSLLSSGLCQAASAYYDPDRSEAPYALILHGCKHGAEKEIEHVVTKTLKEIAERGFTEEQVETALHQLEFQRTEINGSDGPFGLSLFFRTALPAQHGCDPVKGLETTELFNELREHLKEKNYLTDLLYKYFVDNTHRVSVWLKPDKEMAARELADERARLDSIEAKLTSQDREEIAKIEHALEKYHQQSETQDLSCLPKVALEDVSQEPLCYPLKQSTCGNIELFHHNVGTGGVIYASLICDLPEVAEEDLPLLKLMTALIGEVGTQKRGFEELLQVTQAHTGGIGASFSLMPQVDNPGTYRPCLTIGGKALRRKQRDFFKLLHEVATQTLWEEEERLSELVKQMQTNLKQRMTTNALAFATRHATRSFSGDGIIRDATSGLTYYKAVMNLDVKTVGKKLQTMSKALLQRGTIHLLLTCDQQTREELEAEKFYGLCDLKGLPMTPWKIQADGGTKKEGAVTIATSVAYNCRAFPSVEYTHPDAPHLLIGTELMKNLTLHPEIREKGGAYGSSASYRAEWRHLLFTTYRDPNVQSSFIAFEKAVERIAEKKFSDEDLEAAKLGIIQNMDSPFPPGQRGDVAYSLWREGKNKAMRTRFRVALLNATKEEIAIAVKSHLLEKIETRVDLSFVGKEVFDKDPCNFPLLDTL